MSTVDVCQLVLNLLKADGLDALPALRDKQTRPCLQVEEAGGPRSGNANGRLNRQDLQISVWGSSKKEAQQTLARARDLLIGSRNHVASDGTVLVKATATMPDWQPDPDFPVGNRPGPRYVMIVSATAHA